MIDAKRNLNTTYRVSRLPDGIHLKTFPQVPEAVAEAWYRTDQIPQWLLEAMALLDAAAPSSIPDIGHRVGKMVYWVEPPLRDTAGDRIAANINARLALLVRSEDEIKEVEREKTP